MVAAFGPRRKTVCPDARPDPLPGKTKGRAATTPESAAAARPVGGNEPYCSSTSPLSPGGLSG
jgi:hypothetical protein